MASVCSRFFAAATQILESLIAAKAQVTDGSGGGGAAQAAAMQEAYAQAAAQAVYAQPAAVQTAATLAGAPAAPGVYAAEPKTVHLVDVDDRTAAMLMAIVADAIGASPDDLDFISIKAC
jgi:hypothetical protein